MMHRRAVAVLYIGRFFVARAFLSVRTMSICKQVGARRRAVAVFISAPSSGSHDLTHDVSERIIFHDSIVNNKTIGRSIIGDIFSTVEFYANVHSSTFNKFVLTRAIDDYERFVFCELR